MKQMTSRAPARRLLSFIIYLYFEVSESERESDQERSRTDWVTSVAPCLCLSYLSLHSRRSREPEGRYATGMIIMSERSGRDYKGKKHYITKEDRYQNINKCKRKSPSS